MRRYLFLTAVVLLVSNFAVRGQSEAQISQYMFSQESYNPAAIALENSISLFGLHRQQWVGVPNAPATTYFAANMPVNLWGQKHGIGLIFYNDNAGIFSNQSVNFQYAFKKKLTEGNLSLGADLGFISQTIHGDSINIKDIESEYLVASDPNLPTTSINAVGFDCSLGAYYSAKQYYIGLSMLHLFSPELNMDDYVTSYVGRVLYLTGGYTFNLSNPRYKIKPTGLFKTNFNSFQTDLNIRVERDEKYWGGIGWRLQDAVVFFIGLNLPSGISAGYSFDLATTKFISNSAGSHELFLRYNFSLGAKKTNKYKSIRIL